jgi:glycosyltransferase involved in cell wall biosynthesis
MATKIAVIGTAGLPARYGGFEILVRELVNHLSQDFHITVYCSRNLYKPAERRRRWETAELVYIPLKANGYQSVLYDLFSLCHALYRAEVFLILGVSGALFLPFVRVFTNRRIIVHTDGLEWKRERWNSVIRFFLKLSEWIAVKSAHLLIADNPSIDDYLKQRYGKSPALIGYGGDHVLSVSAEENHRERYPFMQQMNSDPFRGYAISVGRIVPENNYDLILKAFSEMPDETIVIVGNWRSGRYGKQLHHRFQQYSNIFLLDPIYDQHELDRLRLNASLYIHGHSSGGTNPGLVEAMYLGLPVIAHENPFNINTTENQAYYFREKTDFKNILRNTSPEAFRNCGKQLQAIAHEKMKWKDVAGKYAGLFG